MNLFYSDDVEVDVGKVGEDLLNVCASVSNEVDVVTNRGRCHALLTTPLDRRLRIVAQGGSERALEATNLVGQWLGYSST